MERKEIYMGLTEYQLWWDSLTEEQKQIAIKVIYQTRIIIEKIKQAINKAEGK